jgi:lipoprotein-releasing system permease protein
VKGILSLYWASLRRLKTSSWGKNSIFMILGIVIAVGALTLSMILFESYEKTLNQAFKVSQPDIYIVNNYTTLTERNKETLEHILESMSSQIKAVDQKKQISVIISHTGVNKPSFIESYSSENDNYNRQMYSFSQQENFSLKNSEIVLGEQLAKDLKVKVGDSIDVILPSSIRYSIFGLVKKAEKFVVKDINKTGLYEIDAFRAIINKSRIEELTEDNHLGVSYSVLLNNRNSDNSKLVTDELNNKFMTNLPAMYARDIFSNNSAIFSALALQKIMIFLILCIIVIVASFNVISTVSTIIIEKINEIGILMTLGLKRREIKVIYFTFSLILAHIGIILGFIFGYGAAYWLTHQDFISLKGDIYFIDKIMINPSISMILIIYATTLIIISMTILFSLRSINKLEIINIVRQ